MRRRWWRPAGHDPDGGDSSYEQTPAGIQERLIVEALVDLRDMDVREVMTPRLDVIALTIPVHELDVVQAVRQSGHSAFPVVHDDLDDLVGVLFVNDLFRSKRTASGGGEDSPSDLAPDGDGRDAAEPGPAIRPSHHPSFESREAVGNSPLEISRRVRQPFVIPESRRLLDALSEMRLGRKGFAVVVDEHGGVAGVLTVKDLLEPLVGKLHDEFDQPGDEPEIVRVDGNRWLVDGQASVDDVREWLGIDLEDGDYVTLGGYLFDGFGHIPREGEVLHVGSWELRVTEMDKRRIVKVVARNSDGDASGLREIGHAADPVRQDGADSSTGERRSSPDESRGPTG